MTDDQRQDLHRLRTKATIEATNAIAEMNDAALVRELLAIAHLMKKQDRPEARDVIHRAIARIEGPETDGALT